jgi:hypothetical protein
MSDTTTITQLEQSANSVLSQLGDIASAIREQTALTSIPWGNLTGDITAQADLVAALGAKASTSALVTYIYEAALTFVHVDAIVNNLDSTASNATLSAAMGHELALRVTAANGSGGYLPPHDFGAADPAQQALTDYAIASIGIDDPAQIFNGTKVQNLADRRVWQLANTPNTTPPVFEWMPALIVETEQRDFTAQPILRTELAPGSVGTNQIGGGAITFDKLAAGAVTYEAIADGTIQSFALAPGAVTGDKIYTGAVGSGAIADEAVTNTKIGWKAVTGDKIAEGAVGNAELADYSVTTNKLGGGQVTQAKISGQTLRGLGYDMTLCHTVYRPDCWPAGVEINFGDGLYGYRWVGTFTMGASQRFTMDLLPYMVTFVQFGGWIEVETSAQPTRIPALCNSSNANASYPLTTPGKTRYFSTSGYQRTDAPYDMWGLYRK